MSTKIPNEFLDGIYSPDFQREPVNLNERIDDSNRRVEAVREVTEQKIAASPDVPVPLSREEAEQVDLLIGQLLSDIKATRERIAALRARIDEEAAQGDELSFEVNIAGKGALKRAIQRVFGFKTNTITYSMYKEVLAAKRQLEDEQASGYVQGDF